MSLNSALQRRGRKNYTEGREEGKRIAVVCFNHEGKGGKGGGGADGRGKKRQKGGKGENSADVLSFFAALDERGGKEGGLRDNLSRKGVEGGGGGGA